MKNKFLKEERVYWTDPDNGECSGFGVITRLSGTGEDAVATLVMDAGGLVEAPVHELCKPEKALKRKNR